MKLYRALLATALAVPLIVPLAGCPAKQPDPPVPAPAAEPALAPPATNEAALTEVVAPAATEPYRVITDNVGKSNVEFTLMINGATVGSYNTDNVENDISSYLRPGENTIKVAWTADSSMNSFEKARLKVQTKRGNNWNDIVTREVARDTSAGDSEIKIQVGPIDPTMPANAQPTIDIPNQPLPASPTTQTPPVETTVEQVPVAPANSGSPSLSEKYIVKTDFSSLVPGSFDVSVNGVSVGSYSTDSNQQLNQYIRPGRNRVTVKWQGKSNNRFSKSVLTVGVNRGDKWSTVGNVTMSPDSLQGEKTFDFTAQ